MGIGVDIESVKRFKSLKPGFTERVYTKKELEYCNRHDDP